MMAEQQKSSNSQSPNVTIRSEDREAKVKRLRHKVRKLRRTFLQMCDEIEAEIAQAEQSK